MKTIHTKEMLKFIDNSPSAFHCAANVAKKLEKAGFVELKETENWPLRIVKKGYVVRNDSSVIAFSIPEVGEARGFRIYSAHSDSPAFRLKEDCEMSPECGFVRINTEGYGGMIMSTWFDRPLSVAGRVAYCENGAIRTKLVNIDRDLLVIPSIAIHMNPEANKGVELKPQSDLLPIYSQSTGKTKLSSMIAKEANLNEEEILASDLFLYTRQKGTIFGAEKEFVLSPRIDDQACVFAGLEAITSIDTGNENYNPSSYINVFCVFDNEEVGSSTKQGADSTMLEDTLFRIAEELSYSRTDYLKLLADSMSLSADNGHAAHPANPGKADPVNKPSLNKGVVLKFNGSQRYATDAVSAGFVRALAKRSGVKLQNYANNSNVRGGSTLGNISTAHVSVPTADIGLPQLAMHSACETAGARDIDDLVKLAEEFFKG